MRSQIKKTPFTGYILVMGIASPWTDRPGHTNFWFDHSTNKL